LDCDAAEPPLLSEYGWPVLVICDGVVLLQLCDADHIRVMGEKFTAGLTRIATCDGPSEKLSRDKLLSSLFLIARIDWHGDHLLRNKKRAKRTLPSSTSSKGKVGETRFRRF